MTIPTPAALPGVRDALLTLIFGAASLPATTPVVVTGVTDPIGLTAASVDRYDTTTSGIVNRAYAYHPVSPDGRIILLHQGHTPNIVPSDLALYNLDALAQDCLDAGYMVVIVGMPGRSGNGGSFDHSTYSSLRPFIEPAIAILNHLDGGSPLRMVGISGGGWATTVVAAIDERVRLSVQVAGTLPDAYRLLPGTIGDFEQREVLLEADYDALYVMGVTDGRRQRQILGRFDDCCFNYANYGDAYAEDLVSPVHAAGLFYGGLFDWVEDATYSEHQISPWAVENAIAPLLGLPTDSNWALSTLSCRDLADAGWATTPTACEDLDLGGQGYAGGAEESYDCLAGRGTVTTASGWTIPTAGSCS